ncbi:endo-alpha-N-acetylgalactosaminidase family protein [Bacillus pacificus]
MKKVALATDELGQAVILKGYANEGAWIVVIQIMVMWANVWEALKI